MQSITEISAHSEPPLWLVSNGKVTVGPVHTDLLLRGVMHGRVPNDSWVKQPDWLAWREVGKIREVSALRRVLDLRVDHDSASKPLETRDGAERLEQASDEGEALLMALHVAALATSATVGLAHRLRDPLRLPTTTCSFEAPMDRLGQVLAWDDPAFVLARSGRGRMIEARGAQGGLEQALSARLGQSLRGLALLPVMVSGKLHALLELGRSDHAFRSSDSSELSRFAERAGRVLERLRSARS